MFTNTLNMVLSLKIKQLCKKQNITIKLLLEKCEMNRNTIYDLENKGSYPSAEKLLRLADYLDCSVDYLLGRTDNPEINKSNTEETSYRIAAFGAKETEANDQPPIDENML